MPLSGAAANTRPRHGSPAPGGSILITSAPKSDRIVAAAGPAIQLAQSITFRPENRLSVMFVSSLAVAERTRVLSWCLVAEDDRAGGSKHATHAVADRDLCPGHLCRRNAAHLPHALLQRVHAVHPRV